MDRSQIVNRNRIKGLIMILLSNGITLLAGIMTGFFVPQMMSIADYGYYKIYNLYFGYLPILHFGLSTGIYLLYGDKSYDELNRDHFRYYFRVLLVSQLAISLLLFIISIFIKKQEYAYIILCLAVVLVASNITNYFQLISQITERYREYSIRNIIQSVLNAIIIGILFGKSIHHKSEVSYRVYLFFVVAIQIILAGWYIWTYRDIIFGRINNRPGEKIVGEIYRSGFILIVAGLVSLLILNIDRQFVSILFSTEEYAVYAFAYSILSLMTTFINAISMIVYPSIKRESSDNLKIIYEQFINILLVVSSLLISSSFILDVIVKKVLPKYTSSLPYIYIIIPTLIVSSLINIVVHNYYKTFNIENKYFAISVLVLVQSCITNTMAYKIAGTMMSISVASVACIACWYLYTQLYLHTIFRFNYLRSSLYLVLIIVSFYMIHFIVNCSLIEFVIYLLVWALLTILFFPSFFMKLKQPIKEN